MLLPLWVGGLALLAAAPPDREVAEGRELYARLKYDRAVVALERALARPELARADRVLALETLGLAYTVLEDAAAAEKSFHLLFDLSPAHQLEAGLSPRLRGGFERARRSWESGRQLALELVSPEGEGTLVVRFTAGDPRRAAEVVARSDDGDRTPLLCQASECRGPRPNVSFLLLILGPGGEILAQSGPHPPLAASGPPWWVWAAAGAAVVAGGVALGVALVPGSAPAGSLGRWQLP